MADDIRDSFLLDIVMILDYQSKPSMANQGQVLDGYSALANYNSVAEKIKSYLSEAENGG